MDPNISAESLEPGQVSMILNWTLFSLAIRNKMLISNATIELFVMTGSPSIHLRALLPFKIMRLNGSGTTITKDLIWGLVALP